MNSFKNNLQKVCVSKVLYYLCKSYNSSESKRVNNENIDSENLGTCTRTETEKSKQLKINSYGK